MLELFGNCQLHKSESNNNLKQNECNDEIEEQEEKKLEELIKSKEKR